MTCIFSQNGIFLLCWCASIKFCALTGGMDAFKNGADALFILLGTIMILAMHVGFAFFGSLARFARKIRSMIRGGARGRRPGCWNEKRGGMLPISFHTLRVI